MYTHRSVRLFIMVICSFADANDLMLNEMPPTLMFHERAEQRDILPMLIDEMLASGYQFTTCSQFYASFQNGERLEKPIIYQTLL
jgi:hypothetical protein